jgi:1-acyl-sn-glycerol-3-phosphate acyltransferase
MRFPGQIAGELPATRCTTKARGIEQPGGLAPAENLRYGKTVFSQKAAFFQKAWYQLGRSLVAAYMRLILDVDIRWHTPLPDGPKILAANHPTTTDPFYLLTLLSEPVSVLVTAGAFGVPVFGPYLRAAGHVPAIHGSGGATVEAVARQVEAGRSVAIFPEGALSPLDGGFHQPHSGVARVALHTGAPVIPIGIGLQRDRIRVTEAEMGGDETIGHLYTSGPYAITVGRPLNFRGTVKDREQVRAVADEIMHRIRDLAWESARRIRPVPAPLAASQASASPLEAL